MLTAKTSVGAVIGQDNNYIITFLRTTTRNDQIYEKYIMLALCT